MLTLYRPFTNLFRDDFGDFNSFFGLSPSAHRAPSFTPAVDVVEQDSAYVLKAEVPGLAPNELEITVENDVLTLKGERKHEHEENRGGYRRVERSYGSFTRSFVLPQGTNAEAIEAKAENGVLSVTIPKPATATPRKIEIKAEGIVDKAKKLFAKPAETATA
jgi:HSP20 family protein